MKIANVANATLVNWKMRIGKAIMKNEMEIRYRTVWTELQLAIRDSFIQESLALFDAEDRAVLSFPQYLARKVER